MSLANKSSKCPVNHSSKTEEKGKAAAGGCPVDHEALKQGAAAKTPAGQKPVCPFGFTSEASSMTSLHCPKCRSLFFNCVATSCGHNFCQECITASPDCLSCGDHISKLTPESHIQELVDTFIETHSSDETFLEGKPVMVKGKTDEKDHEATRATFLLEIGLRSFAGHNYVAASSRLAACRAELLQIVEERGSSPELSIQLGAVCGSQGDCSLQMGNSQGAVAFYESSISYLDTCAKPSLEVQQALTVTQNKLGDLWYKVGQLSSARELYSQALAIRRVAVKSAPESCRLSAELNLAMSLAKYADIQQAMGEKKAHDEALEEARKLSADLGSLAGPQKKRVDALRAFLAAASAS